MYQGSSAPVLGFPQAGVALCAAACLLVAGVVLSARVPSGLEPLVMLSLPLLALVGVSVQRTGMRGAALLSFVGGVVLTDFAPLAVFRYLLLGDVLLLAAAALHVMRTRPHLRIPLLVVAPFLVYLASHLLSLLWSKPLEGALSWLHIGFLVCLVLPLAYTYLVEESRARRAVMPALLFTAFLQALYLVAAVVVQGVDWSGPRLPGAFGSAALFFLGPAWLAGLLLLADGPRGLRVPVLGALIVVAFAIGVLRSRSLWLGTLVGMIVLWGVRSRGVLRGAARAAALVALLAGIYAAGWLPRPIEDRIKASTQVTTANDLLARQEVVWALLPRFYESPLIGLGMNQSKDYLPASLVEGATGAVHNVVINALVEGGLLAGLAVALLPAVAVALWWRSRRHSDPEDRALGDWAFSSLAMLLTALQFTPTLYEHVLYLVFAVAAATAQTAKIVEPSR
jgi:O-antigen ligase